MHRNLKGIRTLHIEEIFDTLLRDLPPGTRRYHRLAQVYQLADLLPFLIKPTTLYRAEFNKLIFLEKGSLQQRIDGVVNTVEGHSLLFVKKGQVFSLDFFGEAIQGFVIFFSPEALGEALRVKYLAQAVEANTLQPLTLGETSWFKNACQLMLTQFRQSAQSTLPIIEHILGAMILKLVELSANDLKNWSRKEELAYHFRKKALENTRRSFEVQPIAEELNVSVSYLYRCVKGITGRSPKRWLLEAALMRSRAMLQQGRLSITQVALESGFDDPSYFGRLFKRHFGVTPRDFQKEIKRKVH